jgi:hypothetical protein
VRKQKIEGMIPEIKPVDLTVELDYESSTDSEPFLLTETSKSEFSEGKMEISVETEEGE